MLHLYLKFSYKKFNTSQVLLHLRFRSSFCVFQLVYWPVDVLFRRKEVPKEHRKENKSDGEQKTQGIRSNLCCQARAHQTYVITII